MTQTHMILRDLAILTPIVSLCAFVVAGSSAALSLLLSMSLVMANFAFLAFVVRRLVTAWATGSGKAWALFWMMHKTLLGLLCFFVLLEVAGPGPVLFSVIAVSVVIVTRTLITTVSSTRALSWQEG